MEVQLGLTLDPTDAAAPAADADAADETTNTSTSGGSGGSCSGPLHPYRLEPSASCLFEDQMELVGALTGCVRTAVLRHVGDCFRLAKVGREGVGLG